MIAYKVPSKKCIIVLIGKETFKENIFSAVLVDYTIFLFLVNISTNVWSYLVNFFEFSAFHLPSTFEPEMFHVCLEVLISYWTLTLFGILLHIFGDGRASQNIYIYIFI